MIGYKLTVPKGRWQERAACTSGKDWAEVRRLHRAEGMQMNMGAIPQHAMITAGRDLRRTERALYRYRGNRLEATVGDSSAPAERSHPMRRFLPFYVLGAAVLVVGVLAFGVPISSLWVLGLVILCPLMMMLMMGGMPSGGRNDAGGDAEDPGDLPEERASRSWLDR